MNPLAEIKARIEENLRVLIVDDEPGIISALKREWRKEPFALVSFTDPSEALQAIRKQEISVILSDNLMPGMTGLELLAQAMRLTPDTRRLLLTGRTELSDAIRAFNEGVLHRFVTKPWEREDLIAYIHEALDAYRAARLHREAGRLKDFALKKRSKHTRKPGSNSSRRRLNWRCTRTGKTLRRAGFQPTSASSGSWWWKAMRAYARPSWKP